ncbi:hypothetical protein A3E15_00490 [Candidatus Woesebacteria bacterium RIFCSPHIGHO2_12_FULL_42_9]|uniref:R3H domain-containing protein n=2 Tax=Candidatus Woeseibacteriota TaxID=1752722 RepID=A0A1F8AT98_9BACT|nr:MAG: hypothetical protein A2129_00040 [Candidatus Woesebacteria bacterium GWC1_42_13]OGM54972.1 MAG: hypothetical protein A3E15_00490 [Candidatus Woesebacteria bacterium RIFCSPHIGHO2_12_FULL_42_9]
MPAKKKETNTEVAQKLSEELLILMGVDAKIDVSEDKENQALVINISSDNETGLLIGRHGQTLLSFQAAIGMMLKQKLGEWIRVIVNVGDWRQKEEEHLKDLAESTAERVRTTGEPQPIYNLTPSQRRIVHLTLSEEPDLSTESEGEGEERYLVVKKKEK